MKKEVCQAKIKFSSNSKFEHLFASEQDGADFRTIGFSLCLHKLTLRLRHKLKLMLRCLERGTAFA
ncbi:MAG: hypothetical protein ACK44E_04130, partial [Anaerolineales bacterium]